MIYLIILLALNNFYATDSLPTINHNKEESLLSCFMRCSTLKPEEPIREKRQVQKVADQIISSLKLMQIGTILAVQDFCNNQESNEMALKCYINECQQGHKDNKLFQKVIDSLQAVQNVTTEICPDKDSKKLSCLVDSQSAILASISGLKCNEAIENFKNDGVSKQFYNKVVVSGQGLCGLFSCPAEAAKDSVEDSCKDFVYDLLSKFGDMYYYDYAFGVEEGKNLLRPFLDYSAGGTHTGEKCADLALN